MQKSSKNISSSCGVDHQALLNEFSDIKREVQPEEEGFYPYSPILSTSDQSNQLLANDNLRYEETDILTLKNNRTGSSSTDHIGDNYLVENLGYDDVYYETNVTDITANKDFYSYESYSGGLVGILRDSPGMQYLAQGFEIKWDYAEFYRTRLYIEGAGNTDEIRIHLVPSYFDGNRIKPDFDIKLSSTIWYSANILPSPVMDETTILELPTYDFSTVVTLTKGFYFIVVEFRDRDNDITDLFLWYGNHFDEDPLKSPLSYQSSSPGSSPVWLDASFNFTLEVELLPVDTFNQPLLISEPETISLKDNNILINSTFCIIENQFVGDHLITANTSVSLTCKRYYVFKTDYNTQAMYLITNSTFGEMTCSWNISWSSNQISTYYTLISRNLTVAIPEDWSNSFNWYYNQTSSFSFEKTTRKYVSYLGSNSSAGIWKIETSSPNHLYSAIFSDGLTETDRYLLGYWTTNETHAFGYMGSVIYVTANIMYNISSIFGDTTGTLNFTLYDRNGNILPIKSSFNESISFIDTTSYSSSGITNSSPGIFETSLIFDPSINGSDLPGFWTAVIYWKNGSEVGFYSQRIIVQTRTRFDAFWEETPESDSWTDYNQIIRKCYDSLQIKAFFYNVSEPFFALNETQITNANITVQPSWDSSIINLDFSNQVYETSLIANFSAGEYNLELQVTGPFLEKHTLNLNLSIFYESAIETVDYSKYSALYANDAVYHFKYVNNSDPLHNTIECQQLSVQINDISLTNDQFSYQTTDEVTTLTVDGEKTALVPGIYSVKVQAYHEDFRADYVERDAQIIFQLEIAKVHFRVNVGIVEENIRRLGVFHFQVGLTIEQLSAQSETNLKFTPKPQGQVIITYVFAFKNGTEKSNEINIEIEENQEEPYNFETEMILVPWQITQVSYSAIFIPVSSLSEYIESSESDSFVKTDFERPKLSNLFNYIIDEHIYLAISSLIVTFVIIAFVVIFFFYLRPEKRSKKESLKKESYSIISEILANVSSMRKIIVVHRETSLPVFELDLSSEIEIDSTLVSGFFQAISSVGVEITKGEVERIRKFDYGKFIVTCSAKENFVTYLLSEMKILEEIEHKLEKFTIWFDEVFRYTAENWVGSLQIFHDYEIQITEKIAEEMYVWTLYNLEINSVKESEIKRLSKLDKRIISLISEAENITISDILERVEDYSIEDKLVAIFSLKENGFLQ